MTDGTHSELNVTDHHLPFIPSAGMQIRFTNTIVVVDVVRINIDGVINEKVMALGSGRGNTGIPAVEIFCKSLPS